jgi:hypothetical protein
MEGPSQSRTVKKVTIVPCSLKGQNLQGKGRPTSTFSRIMVIGSALVVAVPKRETSRVVDNKEYALCTNTNDKLSSS